MTGQLLDLSNYRYNPHAIPLMVVSVLIFFIGLFILLQAKRMVKHISFFLLCLSFTIWLLAMGFVYLCNNAATALLWYKYFTFFGVVSIMPNGYFFSVAASGLLKKQKKTVSVIFITAYLFYLAEIFTDKFITAPRLYWWGYYPHYEPLSGLFIVFFSGLFIALQRNLWEDYKKETIPIKKTQTLTIMIGFMIAFTASTDFVAKFTAIPVYPYGYIPMFIFTCLIAYSIIHYKTFDIETVIHKTVLWILSFLFIVIPVFSLYRVLQYSIQASSGFQFIFWAVSFIVFTVYLRMIQPKIDHLFQRRKANLEKMLNQFIEDLVHLKGFSNLILRIKDAIANALYPQFIDIFVYSENKKKYSLVSADRGEPDFDLKEKDVFLEWLAKNNKIVYREFVYIDPSYNNIRREAENYFNLTVAIVVIPLVLNEKLLGIINLGKKANLRRYSATDFYFLTILKNQSSIAISNSLLYENIEEQVRQRTKELLEVQKQLVQAEKLATVGTLAGGVAHEINNPLAAILTNVQMLLMDDSHCAKMDRESLELIEEATKRCKTIVQKLMTYAKKPLENARISRVNLLNVIKNVNSFIGFQLEQDSIKLTVEAEENGLLVMGNQNELEQVITNIVLNARDATKMVKEKGEIRISFTKDPRRINIIIKDEGIGIPKDKISKIFDPFFTTKDVGKGTGLGLSICQAIVEKHNGTISVQSQVNKGSVFTVHLPRVKNET